MDSRTSRLLPPAETFYVACPEEDRRELDRVLRNLCQDPKVNNQTTFVFAVPPVILSLFRDGRFWIVYHLPNNGELSVLNIGRPPNRPTPHASR
ncbi:MAG: hypothetical protein HY873_13180 [Chloroflexi bacterium]|nr:hypothetical protein [Chloroflexota bacterium]